MGWLRDKVWHSAEQGQVGLVGFEEGCFIEGQLDIKHLGVQVCFWGGGRAHTAWVG
jgi:hypothetical protein